MNENFIEKEANLKYKWRICNKKSAADYGLHLIRIDDNITLLSIDLDKIPKETSIMEFIDFLEETGVVVL